MILLFLEEHYLVRSVGPRIHWLHSLQQRKTHTKMVGTVYDIKICSELRHLFRRTRECGVLLLCHFSQVYSDLTVVVPVRVLTKDKKKSVCKLFILNKNALNHITVCILFVLNRNNWYHIIVWKNLFKKLNKNVNINKQCMLFLYLCELNKPRWVDMP